MKKIAENEKKKKDRSCPKHLCATNTPVGYNDNTFEGKKQENFGEKIAKCVKKHTFGTAYKNCGRTEGILPKARRPGAECFTSFCGNATITLYAMMARAL